MTSTSSAGRIRFAVIGVNHGHIYGMTETIRHAGGELVMFHAEEPDLASDFARRYPSVQRVADERAILEDASIHLVLSAIIPHARAPLGIRVMRHGYARVDWLSPQGLPTWGDTRLTILGTDGYIEVRKNVDLAGRSGANHLFLADATGVRHIDCARVPLPYGRQLVDDVLNRTETAMSQAHCFLAMQLAIEAQARARSIA